METLAWQSKVPQRHKKPIMWDCLCGPYRETGMEGFEPSLMWWAFCIQKMDKKLLNLLDDITDRNGSITLPRSHIELLIHKYGSSSVDLESKEKRAFLIGLFWGATITFFGLIFIYEIINIYF